jgi:hypothetical protein
MSSSAQAIAPNPHTNLLNVYIQIANKMWFQKKKCFINKGVIRVLCCYVLEKLDMASSVCTQLVKQIHS